MKLVWSGLLAGTGIALGCTLACIAPYVAVASFAARTMSLRRALAVVTAMWFGSQTIGFAFGGYPHDARSYAWGAVVLASALLAVCAARRAPTATLGFAAAFAAYEIGLSIFAFAMGSLADFAPAIVAQVLLANVFGAIVLGALGLALVARSAPDWRRLRL